MESALPWLLALLGWAGLAAAFAGLELLRRRLRERSGEMEQLKSQVLEWNRRLEQRVRERTAELESAHRQLQDAYLQTVTSLVEAMTAKDTYLFSHSHSVATYARAIAEELGLSRERIDRLVQGCELHDLGKIAVPDTILLKPGALTEQEFEIVKQHPLWGARILSPLSFMRDITEMVHQEHERWDGSGYPQGLEGERIRLEARIISVADALDAMTSDRPYRARIPLQHAAEEIQRCAGSQFDPRVADACLRAIQKGTLEVVALRSRHAHDRRGKSGVPF